LPFVAVFFFFFFFSGWGGLGNLFLSIYPQISMRTSDVATLENEDKNEKMAERIAMCTSSLERHWEYKQNSSRASVQQQQTAGPHKDGWGCDAAMDAGCA